jgi:hypothetical protein
MGREMETPALSVIIETANGWLSRHERVILLVLFGLIDAVFTYQGASALLRK